MESKTNKLKIVLVGKEKGGKTTFVHRHVDGGFKEEYNLTLGLEVRPLRFYTNKGWVELDLWDCAGDPRYRGLADAYYLQAQGALVFVDLTHPFDKEEVEKWIEEVKRVHSDIPIVIVGTKNDIPESKDRAMEISHWLHTTSYENLKYYATSSRSNYQMEKPFLEVMRHHLGTDVTLLPEPSAFTTTTPPPSGAGEKMKSWLNPLPQANDEEDQREILHTLVEDVPSDRLDEVITYLNSVVLTA